VAQATRKHLVEVLADQGINKTGLHVLNRTFGYLDSRTPGLSFTKKKEKAEDETIFFISMAYYG
jgi:hypothetical protein